MIQRGAVVLSPCAYNRLADMVKMIRLTSKAVVASSLKESRKNSASAATNNMRPVISNKHAHRNCVEQVIYMHQSV